MSKNLNENQAIDDQLSLQQQSLEDFTEDKHQQIQHQLKSRLTKLSQPLNGYLKYIESVEGTFLGFSGGSKKDIEFYKQQIISLISFNRQITNNILKKQRQNNTIYQEIFEMKNITKDKHSSQGQELIDLKKKRKRRKAKQIKRLYTCKVGNCYKNYGSQGALAHHLKVKHPQLIASQIQVNLPLYQNKDKQILNANECKSVSEGESFKIENKEIASYQE